MSVLEQNHNAFDEYMVLETVLRGNKELFSIKTEIDKLYEDYTDANAEKIGELQLVYEEMDGWNADSDAAALLSNLGIGENLHYTIMSDLDGKQKVRVLLAQALFGNPDLLIMDEPTNDLDYETISWLENFLANYDNCVIVVSHDRHFLNSLCTHVADLDYQELRMFTGNYDEFMTANQIALEGNPSPPKFLHWLFCKVQHHTKPSQKLVLSLQKYQVYATCRDYPPQLPGPD